jgi:hypothetical protein
MPPMTIFRIGIYTGPQAIGIQAVILAEQEGCTTESMAPIYDRTKGVVPAKHSWRELLKSEQGVA